MKGGEGEWVIAPEWRAKYGARRRWGGSLRAIALAYGSAAADRLRAEADAAKERGEESVPWPS